jgi:hypothetical protein
LFCHYLGEGCFFLMSVGTIFCHQSLFFIGLKSKEISKEGSVVSVYQPSTCIFNLAYLILMGVMLM